MEHSGPVGQRTKTYYGRFLPLAPHDLIGNGYMSFGGREMSISYRNGVCIPKLESGNDETHHPAPVVVGS
jgi:hypothetical protein